MSHSVPAATLLLACCITAHAAEPTKAATDTRPAEPAAPVNKVEVKAKAEDYDPRRDDTASKTVMSQEEILKYGDTNVYDVLKRAPGVTVVGNSIRMRGLGSGYTQILVNGERPPAGFSMDAVSPDQIERIEIVRGALAEFSTQAIAGTINIVLKKVVTKPQRDLRLTVNHAEEKRSQVANLQLADKAGNLSWFLSGMLQHFERDVTNMQTDRYTAADGSVVQLRDRAAKYDDGNMMAGLFPRLNWKLANDDQLNLSAAIQNQRGGSNYVGETDNLVGAFPAPDYVHVRTRSDFNARFGNVELNWVAKLWGGKLDAKVMRSGAHVDNASVALSATAGDAVQLRRLRDEPAVYGTWRSSGKYTRTLFDGHALAAGWEGSVQTNESRTHRTEGFVGQAPALIDETYSPKVTRLAGFVQDEWSVTKQWSMYVGARWEGIRTDSSGTGLVDTRSDVHVLSPVAQTLYKFPDKSGRQLRMALTHTFKAPETWQLNARRFDAALNTRFTPDSTGNPALRPEEADGLDLTYEHFWAPGAVYSLGTSVRRIHNYIRSTLAQDAQGLWVIRPVNDGNAEVRTLDFDAKFPLKTVMKDAPPVDLRFSLNRNWSKVDAVPWPDNRLDQQIPFSAVFGADYKKEPFSFGINLAYRAGGDVRISREQGARLQARRDVDGYFQYSPRKDLDLRLSIGNALGVDTLGYSRYQDASGTSETWTRSPSSLELRFNTGIKF